MAKKSQVSDADAPPSGQEELEQLRQQLAQERAARASTESALRDEQGRRRQAELAQMGETERRIVAEQESCDSLLESLSGQADSLERQIAALSDEPGHGAEIAKLNRQMSRVEAQILEESRRKEVLASQREAAKKQPAPEQHAAGRQLANGVPTQNFSPTTRAWLDKHPQAYTDVAYCKRIIALALNAVDVEGIQPDTPEYFAYLEEKTGERQPERRVEPAQEDEGEEIASAESPYSRQAPAAAPANTDGDELSYEPRQPQSRAAGPGSIAAAAPPSRSIPGRTTAGGPKRTPALSPQEREVADSLYAAIPNAADRYKKYAENKAWKASRENQHFTGLN